MAGSRRDDIARLTEAAMSGQVPLEEVYGRRLEMIRPSRADLDRVGERYIASRIPGVETTVAQLRRAGVDVRVISGGLLPAVLILTRFLGLPDGAVAAVDVHFDDKGRYSGFDTASPLARAGGKAEVIRQWTAGAGPIMLVGDGATDLEAKDAVTTFVAFTGVVRREQVAAGADHVIDELSLDGVVSLVLDSPKEALDGNTTA